MENYQKITDKYIISYDSLNRIGGWIGELGLAKRDSLHLRLLTEETLGMVKAMTGDYEAVIWFAKDNDKEASIFLTIKAEDIDLEQKKELIEVSTEKTNAKAKGFMGKIADIIENGLLSYENVCKLQQEYGGGYIDYGTMGISGSMDGIEESALAWSLYEYRTSLETAAESSNAAKEAWDELEKSIVASLAKDVKVGVQRNVVDMTITCELKGN
ncbi:hypothetical protein [Butyrivibrio sp. MC2021]|uniref:hypothetical protein n=1 Tax=Butyrivibrio sp. MC2021 TaxID=1408306 RepID=UPI00047EFD47|nr:hypothetical protein [Butyrivibrio sp. MC2021]